MCRFPGTPLKKQGTSMTEPARGYKKKTLSANKEFKYKLL
jgi:hypothetical protein